jgi:transcriptional regulator with XRE-family HTH domain
LRFVQEGEPASVFGDPEAVFAARMRQARETAGMTQPQLAERLYEQSGIRLDPTAITRMERGRRTIRLNEAVHLAAILDMKLWDLVLLPSMMAGTHAKDMKARARAMAAEAARLDAQIVKAEADAVQAHVRAADLRERRQELESFRLGLGMSLSMIAGEDDADGEQDDAGGEQ